MIISFTDAGEIVQIASKDQPKAVGCLGRVFLGVDFMPDPDLYYIAGATNDPAIANRPSLQLDGTYSQALGVPLIIEVLPEGTVVLIDDVECGVTGTDPLSIDFPFAGDWRVTLAPPFPWRQTTIEVNVT